MDADFTDLVDCLQELTITSDTLFLGDSLTMATLEAQNIAGEMLLSHDEKIIIEIPDLWQTADFMYFPNSKAARLFLSALNEEEVTISKQKKIIVMGQKTKEVFDQYQISVIQTAEPSYESVVEKLKEEMKR